MHLKYLLLIVVLIHYIQTNGTLLQASPQGHLEFGATSQEIGRIQQAPDWSQSAPDSLVPG